MGISVDELITFCEEKEYNHSVSCKRYDDASGYTRSKDKNIRTAVAIREKICENYYKQIIDIIHKYQKIEEVVKNRPGKFPLTTLDRIIKVVDDKD